MGFFDIFRKKESGERRDTPLKKKLAGMRCKAVNYEATDFTELCGLMEKDAETVAKLKPVNYYALKDEYIEAAFYSDSEHEENYVIFRLMKNDRPVCSSAVYPVSKDILRKTYTRLGSVDF